MLGRGESKDAHRSHGAAWFMVGLGLLRSRPLHERILLGVVVLAALMGMARENQTRTIARLVAWDKAVRARARQARPG